MLSFNGLIDDCAYYLFGFLSNFDLLPLRQIDKHTKTRVEYFLKHNITSLDFTNIRHSNIDWILKHCSNLEVLILPERKISRTMLDSICKMHTLKTLGICFSSNISAEELCQITSHCVKIEKLSISSGEQITDSCIKYIAQRLKMLKGIDMSYCRKVTDEGVTALALNGLKIEEINLAGNELITDRSIKLLAAHAKQLKSVNLSACHLISTTAVLDLAANCSGLEHLILTRSRLITNQAMIIAAKSLVNLKSLDLSWCQHITDEAICEIVTRCRDLELLHIAGIQLMTDRSLQCIGEHLKKLTSLYLNSCFTITDHGICEIAVNCLALRELNLSEVHITDRSMTFIANHLLHLKVLNLDICPAVSSDAISDLVAKCHDLEQLYLTGNANITDVCVNAIADNCTHLKQLVMSVCHQVTDASICRLAQKLPCIQELSLTDMLITDRSVDSFIEYLHDPEIIDLSFCPNITREAVDKLKSRHPILLDLFD